MLAIKTKRNTRMEIPLDKPRDVNHKMPAAAIRVLPHLPAHGR
jgi:hypothetical protein